MRENRGKSNKFREEKNKKNQQIPVFVCLLGFENLLGLYSKGRERQRDLMFADKRRQLGGGDKQVKGNKKLQEKTNNLIKQLF